MEHDLRIEIGTDELMKRLLEVVERLFAVNDDLVDVVGQKITDGPLKQRRLLIDDLRRMRRFQRGFHLVPERQKHVEVALEKERLASLSDSPADQSHSVGDVESAQDFLQTVALPAFVDFGREPDMVGIGKKHKIASGNRQVCRDARALCSDRPLRNLNQQLGAAGKHLRNVLDRDLPAVNRQFKFVQPARPVAAAEEIADLFGESAEKLFLPSLFRGILPVGLLRSVDFPDVVHDIVSGRQHVTVMKKGVLLRTDIDEGGFESRFQMRDFPEIDGAWKNVIGFPFDLILLKTPVLQQRKTRFQLFAVDYDLFPVFRHSSFLTCF